VTIWTLCVVGWLGAATPTLGDRPDLVGTWQMDEGQSEQPSRKLRALEPGEMSGRQPEESEGVAPGGEAPPAEARQRGRLPSELQAPVGLGEFLEAPRTLSIGGTAAVVVFEDERGGRLELPLDGRVYREGALSCSGRWVGDSLVVEKTNETGITLTHRYNLLEGSPRRLEVYSRLAGKDERAVTLRRVYEAAPKDH
jgi:hypothetical protein